MTSQPNDTALTDLPEEIGNVLVQATEVAAELPQEDAVEDAVTTARVVEAPVVPVVPVAPVAVKTPKPQSESVKTASAPVSSLDEEHAFLNEVAISGSEVQKRILEAIKTFDERLTPKRPMASKQGYLYQKEFFDYLLWLLDREPEDFEKGWRVLLVYFNVHHGTPTTANYSSLSEFRAHCFADDWQDEAQREAYSSLITLLRATRNPITRAQRVREFLFDMISPEYVSGRRVENLKRFYKV